MWQNRALEICETINRAALTSVDILNSNYYSGLEWWIIILTAISTIKRQYNSITEISTSSNSDRDIDQ